MPQRNPQHKKEINEWVQKANQDYSAALRLSDSKKPLTEIVCFHCQQAAEKYLKAFLISNKVSFPKVHDLEKLNLMCIKKDADFAKLKAHIQALAPYAVDVRYPGATADITEAHSALKALKDVRAFIRAKLPNWL